MGDPPEGDTARRNRVSALLVHGEQPPVERSLDQFIERANEQLLDVTSFDADKREQSLSAELDRVKSKLAEPELRAAIAGRSRAYSWRGLVGAFVVGLAVMFAAATLVPSQRGAPPASPITQA